MCRNSSSRSSPHQCGQGIECLDGEDNESLQDSFTIASPTPSTARSSRLLNASPLGDNPSRSLESTASDTDVRWNESQLGHSASALPAVSEQHLEAASSWGGTPLGGALQYSLTEETLALQDTATAKEGSQSTITDSLPAISRAVSERCAEIADCGGSQQSVAQLCQSQAEGTAVGAALEICSDATCRDNSMADDSRRKLCSLM